MITYLFPEPGSIPGIPGLFANCRVDVDETTGTYVVSPLSLHPHFEASIQENDQVETSVNIEQEGE